MSFVLWFLRQRSYFLLVKCSTMKSNHSICFCLQVWNLRCLENIGDNSRKTKIALHPLDPISLPAFVEWFIGLEDILRFWLCVFISSKSVVIFLTEYKAVCNEKQDFLQCVIQQFRHTNSRSSKVCLLHGCTAVQYTYKICQRRSCARYLSIFLHPNEPFLYSIFLYFISSGSPLELKLPKYWSITVLRYGNFSH